MSDIKLILYKENRAPRSIALSSRMVYRTLFAIVIFAILLVSLAGMTARFYWLSRAKGTQHSILGFTERLGSDEASDEETTELQDQIDQLNAKLKNAEALATAPKTIDKNNPALALFPPIVVDKTENQDRIIIGNFNYAKAQGGKPTLTFDLNNAHPGGAAVKGYIVVLSRNETGLHSYPEILNQRGPYLLDFEKGETFQVSRFRQVNATFSVDSKVFQVLIFTRNGELLVNKMYEVSGGNP